MSIIRTCVMLNLDRLLSLSAANCFKQTERPFERMSIERSATVRCSPMDQGIATASSFFDHLSARRMSSGVQEYFRRSLTEIVLDGSQDTDH